ncbi:hypothetical protein FQN57_005344 [Myotisia sp. PD_48]|nr:hypothetical protein FQN57_005344 [Myotisia sp. PD_48]
MVKIDKFAIERWVAARSLTAKYDLSSSYAKPLSIHELMGISDQASAQGPISADLLSRSLGYGEMDGSTKLRSTLAGLYSVKTPEPLSVHNISTTSGGSQANYLVFQALCERGDHVITQYPTYQQLTSIPRSIGAEVSLWKSKSDESWRLDVDELKDMIKPNTKMIVLTNPHNPTGAILPRSTLREVIEIAREHSIIVFCDEIYRPLFHSISPADPEFPPSAISLDYENVIVTGSMSKAYAMPGIRVGWIASRNLKFIDQCITHRSYTTISVSQIDEEIAAFALDGACLHPLLKRNLEIARRNLPLVDSFIEQHRWACEWVRPVASSTGFIKFSKIGKPVDDAELCTQLFEKKGLLLVPGSSCFGDNVDFKGYVRIGYAGSTEELEAALKELKQFMQEDYEHVAWAK